MDSVLHNVWGCYHGYICNNENTILFSCCKILRDGTQVVDVLSTLTWHTWTSTSRKTTCGYLLLSMLKAGAILTQGWQLGREERACYRSILGPAVSSKQCYQVHKSEVKNERNYTVEVVRWSKCICKQLILWTVDSLNMRILIKRTYKRNSYYVQ